jgi:hypothetical protein
LDQWLAAMGGSLMAPWIPNAQRAAPAAAPPQ